MVKPAISPAPPLGHLRIWPTQTGSGRHRPEVAEPGLELTLPERKPSPDEGPTIDAHAPGVGVIFENVGKYSFTRGSVMVPPDEVVMTPAADPAGPRG
jgi:hypothetical protein